MTKADYEGVCHNMRLASGVLWPMPITLDVTEEFAKNSRRAAAKSRCATPKA
jgi:ATP sulfurylase